MPFMQKGVSFFYPTAISILESRFLSCLPQRCAFVLPLSSEVQRRQIHTSPLISAPVPKKSAGAFKAGMTVVKKKIEVESDPQKLVNYLCGGQFMKEGPEIKLGPDSDYPDWIWTLRTGPPPTLEELDPNSLEYWQKVNAMKRLENARILKAAKGKRWLIRKPRPSYGGLD